VATFGTEPFNYQWVKDGVNLLNAGDVSGVNTDTLTLANVQVADEGDFTVVVTNNSGSVTSSVAALTVIVTDTDGDGVLDQDDECPDTASGAVVDEHGCSIEQLVPCEGPRTGGEWKNHGEYVSAVVRVVRRFLTQGMITEQQAGDIVRAAAQSDCGKERNSGRGRGKGLNTRPTPRHSFPVMPRRPF
jgi:hypothetical protein